jgi:hypothetical protein
MGPRGQGFKAFAIWGTLGFLLVLPMLYMDWGTDSPYPELERGVQVVRYLSSPKQMQGSSFLAVYPKGRPSEFVKWMFSPMGTSEWPPVQNGMEMVGLEQAMVQRIPVIPANLHIVEENPHPDKKLHQLVVKADDARGMLVVDAYTDPAQPPVFTREWSLKFPK